MADEDALSDMRAEYPQHPDTDASGTPPLAENEVKAREPRRLPHRGSPLVVAIPFEAGQPSTPLSHMREFRMGTDCAAVGRSHACRC